MLFSELAREFLSCIAFTNAASTVAYYRRFLDAFQADVGDLAIEALKPLQLLKWGRTWHHVQAVQRLFSWACEDAEILTKNPFKKVKKPRPGERKRTIDRKALARLLRAADTDFRPFLLAMRETIARPQEIRALRWEYLVPELPGLDVRAGLADGGCVFVLEEYKSKNRVRDPEKPRVLLVTRRLRRLLFRLARDKGELIGPVFTNSRGEPWTSNAVRLRMRRLRDRCRLGPDHRGEKVVAYTIRHSQATAATARGVRDRVLAEVLGHRSTRTTARYQHLDTSHLRAALGQLDPERVQTHARSNPEATMASLAGEKG